MGYEYMLDFEVHDPDQADQVLRSVPGLEGYSSELKLYSFRRVATGTMPDADVKIETSGIYICYNGGERQIVRDIQAAFAAVGLFAEPREL